MKVGCCGWSYLRPNQILDLNKDWKKKYDHKVQAYADVFNLVEVNSTFYKFPQVKTARKWKRLARKVNPDFMFTVKARKIITHKDRFKSKKSIKAFKKTKEIAEALDSDLILLQTPGSLKADENKRQEIKNFLDKIETGNIKLVWEFRGKQWDKEKVKEICKYGGIEHCVDILKEKPVTADFGYFRLHGLGSKKYKYKYSNEDLKKLKKKVKGYEECHILFNNYEMHPDALRFEKFIETDGLEKVPWKGEALYDTIKGAVEFPVGKEEILEKCGKWWVWWQPNQSLRVKQILGKVKKEVFRNKRELIRSSEKAIQDK